MSIKKFLKHTITEGDSLQSISVKYLGNASRGLEIAILNDLDYPFIVSIQETPSKSSVKTAGDTILIPVEVDDTYDLKDVSDNLDSIVLGSDILLRDSNTSNLSYMSGGEFEVNSYGDLQTAQGIDSLVQDLLHRLITEIGTLPYHPTYGSTFLKIVGNRNDTEWRQKAVLELARTFRCDPRVVDVRNVALSLISTGIAISCTVVTASTEFTLKDMIEGV